MKKERAKNRKKILFSSTDVTLRQGVLEECSRTRVADRSSDVYPTLFNLQSIVSS